MQRPVRQTRDAAAAGDELDHHRSEFCGAYPQRLDAGGVEERREDVESRAIDGITDQHLAAQIIRFDPLVLRERMRRRNRQLCLIREQRAVSDVEVAHWICGNDEVEVSAAERR